MTRSRTTRPSPSSAPRPHPGDQQQEQPWLGAGGGGAVPQKPRQDQLRLVGHGLGTAPGGRNVQHGGRRQSIHVPYKGSGPMQTDLIGGQIDFSFDTMTAATAQVRAGKMLGIAQTRVNRAKGFPAMPTMDEQGFKGFDASSWYGVVGTRDMSRNWPSASMPTSTACWPCPTWSAASTDTAWRTVAAPWTSSRPSWLPNTGSGATWCALQNHRRKLRTRHEQSPIQPATTAPARHTRA